MLGVFSQGCVANAKLTVELKALDRNGCKVDLIIKNNSDTTVTLGFDRFLSEGKLIGDSFRIYSGSRKARYNGPSIDYENEDYLFSSKVDLKPKKMQIFNIELCRYYDISSLDKPFEIQFIDGFLVNGEVVDFRTTPITVMEQ